MPAVCRERRSKCGRRAGGRGGLRRGGEPGEGLAIRCPRRQSRAPCLPESSCLCPSSRPEPQLLHLPVMGKRFLPGRAFAGVGRDDAGRAGGPGRGRHVTAGGWPPLTQGPRLAFQAEGRGGGARDQQPHAGPALPAPPRPAPPRPRHVRLFPPVGDLGDRPRCPGGSAAAPHQVRSRGPCGVRGAGLRSLRLRCS